MELNRNVVVIAHPADSVREILSQAFDAAGFVTQATTRGEEAIRLVWEWHPMTVLLALDLDPEAWDAFTRGSAIRRVGRAGLARNVCVAMGNWLAELDELPAAAVAVLRDALEDPESLVRDHAAWALEQAG